MLTFRKSKSGEKVSLILKNEVGIEEAAKMKKQLLKGLADESKFFINLEDATDLHLSIIQLIIAAVKEAEKQKKEIYFKGHDSSVIKTVLEKCGMVYKDGVVLENEKHSFWVAGGM